MIERGVNAPLASSAGRLFDACAAVLGICLERQSYEGQAGMEMEALASPFMDAAEAWPATSRKGPVISWKGLWEALLRDQALGVETGLIAARFHRTLIEIISRKPSDSLTKTASARSHCPVALSRIGCCSKAYLPSSQSQDWRGWRT